MLEQMTIYPCFNCGDLYYGGPNDYDAAIRENSEQQNFLCQKCACDFLGYGQDFCALHGNEFIDFKCMYCCSIALFVSEGGKQYDCQPCIHNALEK